ncbi:MAG TPA: hypothetical protein VLI45_05235 [Acidobacteriaceae bacterium]|nr:hypothetical protein [Acidobacteriaceae bacterium]
MNLLPKASGSRPRIACEISPDGVVAARATQPGASLEAVARAALAEGAVMPSLRPGNLVDGVAVVAALRRVMDSIGLRANSRAADVTLIIPDGAVRVLLLDFDTLPNKLSEALPLVRFRLKKLVPFETNDAVVSFQVMSSARNAVRVLAVAIPQDVLSEYENAVREAGFEPGAVLPSTLAALPALSGPEPVLLANASSASITTAIVREGILMLHRSIDLQPGPAESTVPSTEPVYPRAPTEPAPVTQSPYTSPTLMADLNAELHNAILVAPTSLGTLTDPRLAERVPEIARAALQPSGAEPVMGSPAEEIAQAISVAIAYYEDNVAALPSAILSAGPLGADGLRRILQDYGIATTGGVHVHELIDTTALTGAGAPGSVSRSAFAGVAGALRG